MAENMIDLNGLVHVWSKVKTLTDNCVKASDLATVAGALSAGQSSVFTTYFAANVDYSLTITNAGTIKYIGNASDLAITSAGLLLNIMMTKDFSDNLTSIVQASKLGGGA